MNLTNVIKWAQKSMGFAKSAEDKESRSTTTMHTSGQTLDALERSGTMSSSAGNVTTSAIQTQGQTTMQSPSQTSNAQHSQDSTRFYMPDTWDAISIETGGPAEVVQWEIVGREKEQLNRHPKILIASPWSHSAVADNSSSLQVLVDGCYDLIPDESKTLFAKYLSSNQIYPF